MEENIKIIKLNALELSDEQIKECSELFSKNYGVWSKDVSFTKPLSQIKLSSKRYIDNYKKREGCIVLLAYDGELLVGQNFYLTFKHDNQTINFVIQLVISKEYENQGIATSLLKNMDSADANFIYSANPYTIYIFDKVFNHLDISSLGYNELMFIKSVLDKMPEIINYDIIEEIFQVNTQFYIDHSSIKNKVKNLNNEKNYYISDSLKEGYEYLGYSIKQNISRR